MLPSGPSFQVEPGRLQGLSTTFTGEADRMRASISGFEGPATHVDQAFGLLGPSDDLYFEYLGLARDTLSGLRHLLHALEGAAQRLRATADSYEGAEAHSAIPRFAAGR